MTNYKWYTFEYYYNKEYPEQLIVYFFELNLNITTLLEDTNINFFFFYNIYRLTRIIILLILIN